MHAIRPLRARVLEGKGVFIDSAQPFFEVGHNLLSADHEEHASCPRGVRPELTPAH